MFLPPGGASEGAASATASLGGSVVVSAEVPELVGIDVPVGAALGGGADSAVTGAAGGGAALPPQPIAKEANSPTMGRKGPTVTNRSTVLMMDRSLHATETRGMPSSDVLGDESRALLRGLFGGRARCAGG